VVTHRDPVSVGAIRGHDARVRRAHELPHAEARVVIWPDRRIRQLLEASVRDRVAPSGRTIDVLFHEFMSDDLATVERIYDAAGPAMTRRARADRRLSARAPAREGRSGDTTCAATSPRSPASCASRSASTSNASR
jgi:hypothetical protein